jgi:hypothetical protein
LRSARNDFCRQGLFIGAPLRHLPLDQAMLTTDAAGKPF